MRKIEKEERFSESRGFFLIKYNLKNQERSSTY